VELGELGGEGGVGDGLAVLDVELVEGGDQRLRDVTSTEVTEVGTLKVLQ